MKKTPMKKIFSTILSMLVLGMFMTSCDVHQFPEANLGPDKPDTPVVPDDPNEPDNPDTPDPSVETAPMTLHLNYLPDLYVWEHTYESKMGKVTESHPELNIYPDYPGTSDCYSNIIPGSVVEVNVKVHKDNTNKTLVSSHSFITEVDDSYDADLTVDLPVEEDYIVTVWSHLLSSKEDNPFYDPSDFNSIKLVKERYTGNTDYRDGFRGRLSVSVPDVAPIENEILMLRPMGKFEFVSTDLNEFLANEDKRQGLATRADAKDYTVVISYPAYYPSAYSAMDDRLENSGTGYSFATNMTVTGDNEVSLGFDYVMINNTNDAAVQAQVTIFASDGSQVSNSGMITIPMRRDHHTVVRGNFLTISGSGGVGIDPDFEGDFNVPIQ